MAVTITFGAILVVVLLIIMLNLSIERDTHKERAGSMFQFIQEVRAADKYLEWEGKRNAKKSHAELVKDYAEYGSPPPEEPKRREWIA